MFCGIRLVNEVSVIVVVADLVLWSRWGFVFLRSGVEVGPATRRWCFENEINRMSLMSCGFNFFMCCWCEMGIDYLPDNVLSSCCFLRLASHVSEC